MLLWGNLVEVGGIPSAVGEVWEERNIPHGSVVASEQDTRTGTAVGVACDAVVVAVVVAVDGGADYDSDCDGHNDAREVAAVVIAVRGPTRLLMDGVYMGKWMATVVGLANRYPVGNRPYVAALSSVILA